MMRFVLPALFLFLSGHTLCPQSRPEWEAVFKSIDAEVQQHSAAYGNLQKATENIGHRLTGSAQGAKAETYAFELLRSYGLQVRYAPFEAESWSRGSLSVLINNKKYEAVSLAHSPVKANVSGRIADMGNGLEQDYLNNPGAAKGKIVLASLGILPGSPAGIRNLHRSEKTALAIRFGAKAIILFNAAPGDILLTGTASVTGKLISIPAICIGNEDGMHLKKQLKTAPAAAGIVMTNFSGKIRARNIIASLPGKTVPGEKVVIGGHLDSWDLATGAIDNGIGSFSVMDIARTFKALNLQPQRTVEFVLFMGEEQGLLGSKAYVKKALQDGTIANIKYMLNLDMSNDPKGYSATTDEDKALFQSIGSIANSIDTSFSNTFRSGFGLHSDHQPFMLQGIPTGSVAGSLSREALNCYHADCDVFSLVNEQELKNTIRFSAMLLYGLADAPELQSRRLNDDELKAALLRSNLKEPLKISGEWRWKD
ncbi:M28 family peptidase [Agriterribacter sp.]|uniref:M28 family peptidase n=1 Tax=Agriterribacter sp. TaxID=2821509 RepID=UPI002BC2939B|nr:M28 family peptidase [Agriterribacter sp.]HRP56201.1 M28 family peptidase [Agriterribacter sp.]